MELRGGKFYEKGVLVPLEFGNKEQIKLMKEHQDRIDALNSEDGVETDVEVTRVFKAEIAEKCTCGQTVWFEIEDMEDETDVDEFNGMIRGCPKCQKKYVIKHEVGVFYFRQYK